MSTKKLLIGAAIAGAALSGGSLAASDYPPTGPTGNTVLSSGGSTRDPSSQSPAELASGSGDHSGIRQGQQQQQQQQLPSTGGESGSLIKIAGGAVAAGAGLVVVATRRRRTVAG